MSCVRGTSWPLLFTLLALGFRPRISTGRSDSGESRIDKIVERIRESRYSIHDISRLVATEAGQFARFNLPYELGVDRGAQLFGSPLLWTKRILVLEREPYDYKRAMSDFSGADIKNHKDNAILLVRAVRNWFVETVEVSGAREGHLCLACASTEASQRRNASIARVCRSIAGSGRLDRAHST